MGTVGLLAVEPEAVNSIPRRAGMDIDLRDMDAARRDALLERVRAACGTPRRRAGSATPTRS
ncbi:MAG TPA: hypothetical protein VK904_09440 [Miltoncostaeaceae bacterium]|nr:hypothetical protein [Miltoncostaeaceae bacterium]